MTFTLVIDNNSYRLTDNLSCWVDLLDPLVEWDSTSINVWDILVKGFSGISICELGHNIGWTLEALIGFNNGPPSILQMILDSPLGPKVRYPDFLGYPFRSTLALPLVGYGTKFVRSIPGLCPTIPWHSGINKFWCESKCNSKVQRMVELRICLCSPFHYCGCLGFKIFGNPPPPYGNISVF